MIFLFTKLGYVSFQEAIKIKISSLFKSFFSGFYDLNRLARCLKHQTLCDLAVFFSTKDYAPRLFDEPALMVDEMTQLGLKHIMFQALRDWDPKIIPFKWYNFKGEKACASLFFLIWK